MQVEGGNLSRANGMFKAMSSVKASAASNAIRVQLLKSGDLQSEPQRRDLRPGRDDE